MNNVDPAVVEAEPDFNPTRLLAMARLLVSDPAFFTEDSVLSETLVNLVAQPSCEGGETDFVKLYNSMMDDPSTYTGTNPINDIIVTIKQLISCQNSTSPSLLSKIKDFFKRLDGGKAIRKFLLLTIVIIHCLALWYVLQRNNMAQDVETLQNFCKAAIQAEGVDKVATSDIPPVIQNALDNSQYWDGRLETVSATFRVGTLYPAPVLLAFNKKYLVTVLTSIEQKGPLPRQVESQAASGSSVVPVAFLPRNVVVPFLGDLVSSGQVTTM